MTRTLICLALFALLVGCIGPTPEAIPVEELREFPRDTYVYRVMPGDEIRVEVGVDRDYDSKSTVLPDGRAVFKYVGEVEVYNLTLKELRDNLAKRFIESKIYNDPRLQVSLLRANGPDPIVFLGNWGAATSRDSGGQQGAGSVIPYRRGIGLTECIARVGGPGEVELDLAPYVYVVRDIKNIAKRTVYRYDLALARRGGTPDLPLHPGDCVFLDQSWLQDMGRALGVFNQLVGPLVNSLGTALLIDTIADGGFAD